MQSTSARQGLSLRGLSGELVRCGQTVSFGSAPASAFKSNTRFQGSASEFNGPDPAVLYLHGPWCKSELFATPNASKGGWLSVGSQADKEAVTCVENFLVALR